MRLPNTAHTSRPWRIHELTRDFRLEDVWALPTPGGRPDDFPRLVEGIASGNPSQSPSFAARTLWAIRWRVGELLGWDGPDAGLGSRVPTLGDRLPADLRDAPSGPTFDALPFASLYLLDDEWAAEVANRTVHGVMHIGWVPDGAGGYRGQMAVLVKPNGLLGSAYMAAIRPFRHLIVYPAMMRKMRRDWRVPAMNRDIAIDLLDRLHKAQNEFYAGGSGAALRHLLAADITWTVPGDNRIAGTYHGLEEVLDYMRRRRDLADGTFQMRRRDVLVGNGNRLAAVTDGFASIRDVDHRWSTVGLYEVIDGRIAACWLLPLDQRAFDAIWSA
jgi:ketosteroid isomerase-like protein